MTYLQRALLAWFPFALVGGCGSDNPAKDSTPDARADAKHGSPVSDSASDSQGATPDPFDVEDASGSTAEAGIEDIYSHIPDITTFDGGGRAGPAGGRLTFADGSVLEIPPGALTSDIALQMSPSGMLSTIPPGFVSGGGDVTLTPADVDFALPLRWSFPLADPASGSALVVLSMEQPPQSLAVTLLEGNRAAAYLWHGSHLLMRLLPDPHATVGSLTGCLTSATRGISEQIREVMLELYPGLLQAVANPRMYFGGGVPRPLYLQPAAAADLAAALDTSSTLAPLLVVDHWHSPVDDYISTRCSSSPRVSSREGTSIGLSGRTSGSSTQTACSALPTEDPRAMLDSLHPSWGRTLDEHGFAWSGSASIAARCQAPSLFEHAAGVPAGVRSKSLEAFQVLWNRRSQCGSIPQSELQFVKTAPAESLDAANLPVTFAALGEAPVTGLPAIKGTPGRFVILDRGNEVLDDSPDSGYDGSGRVRDTATGLEWTRFAYWTANSKGTQTQAEAAAYCDRRGMRLPTKSEALAVSGDAFAACAWGLPDEWFTWVSDTDSGGQYLWGVYGEGDATLTAVNDPVNNDGQALCVAEVWPSSDGGSSNDASGEDAAVADVCCADALDAADAADAQEDSASDSEVVDDVSDAATPLATDEGGDSSASED